MRKQLQSFFDIVYFSVRVLELAKPIDLVITLISICAGLYFFISDIEGGAWLSVAVATLSAGRAVMLLGWRWLSAPARSLKSDPDVSDLLDAIVLPVDYKNAGYARVATPVEDGGIVCSPYIDRLLRDNAFRVSAEHAARHRVRLDRALADNAAQNESVLRCGHRRSLRSDPPRAFTNEHKTSIANDLIDPSRTIELFKSSYYHSFLTNELATRFVETRGPQPRIVYRGIEAFPVDRHSGCSYLKAMAESSMSNHIGISTLALTSDHQLIVWRQGASAQQSRARLAPTGSGSCDWRDWRVVPTSDLNILLARAMERELREEASLPASVQLQTRVIGYFRWLRRAGKPEFLGVTRVEQTRALLLPDASEVDDPASTQTVFPAARRSELLTSLGSLLDSPHLLSLPLWANLRCLKQTLLDAPDWTCDFLQISND